MLKIIGGTVLIVILLVAAGLLGHREFRKRQQLRLVTEANALIARGDLKRAGLDARRLLQINPESAEACRVLAQIWEKTGAHSALDWRRRVVELNAATAGDLIALGRTAIRFSDWTAVSLALSKFADADKDSADYHAFLAEIAFARRDGAEMARQLTEAIRIDPAKKENVWRLAVVQLGASDSRLRENGLATLSDLQSNPVFRRDALRSLIEDAMRQNDSTVALEMARKLDALPERNFADRLLLVTALQAARDPAFGLILQELRAGAVDNAEQIAALIAWMNAHDMAASAIGWGAKLPPAQTGKMLVAVALSDSYVATGDWAGMLQFVQGRSWGQIDYLRSALAARSLRELGNDTGAQTQWREAVKKINAAPKQALVLAAIVEKWGWETENTELLWIAARDPDKGDEALQTLYLRFAKTGATRDLYRVCLHREEFHPADRDIQNNVAQLSLLLNSDVEHARGRARDLFEQEPGNAAYVSTYAFSLLHFGDARKALKVMNGLSDAQLRQPEIAAYYGVILAAVSDTERATEFLALGQTAKLLPEERALVEKARRMISKSSVSSATPLVAQPGATQLPAAEMQFSTSVSKPGGKGMTKHDPLVGTSSKGDRSRHNEKPQFSWRQQIVTTVFWIGENARGHNPVPNHASCWDKNWGRNYGGFDDPNRAHRRGLLPSKFTPRQNPFYCALPYNDKASTGHRPEAPRVVPWFKERYQGPAVSTCKGHWIAIRKENRTVYAQWEDAGPFRTDHWQYVFGNERPKANLNKGAGLDVSPAVRDYLGLQETDVTDWKFVDFAEVPPGPWGKFGDNNTFVINERKGEVAQARNNSTARFAR